MIPPHGGRLVHRELSEPERDRREAEIDELPQLTPFDDAVYDAEKIAIGAYSPLEGFMDQSTLDSVLGRGRLPNDLPWTMPIVLAPRDGARGAKDAKPGDDIALRDAGGRFFALFHFEEAYPLDRTRLAERAYGTTDPQHPNVADIRDSLGDTAWAGRIDLVRRLEFPHRRFELTPEETRARFRELGWRNVVGYQTRNVPHTAHEYLQRCSLERGDVDGLFVHPVVGRLKKGDYRPEVIVEAYDTLVRHYYPANRVVLGSLSIAMRYGGPKAALFLAIVRKNYGCGLYIVGRDQAGVGRYYDPYASQRVFDEYDIGVTPLRYEETFFCEPCGWMATPRTCAHSPNTRLNTSQTRIRGALSRGEPLPSQILRPEVAKILARGDVLLTE
jgi:sulfate adenylyltransferase